MSNNEAIYDLAHKYIRVSLKVGYTPPEINMWLLNTFSMIRIQDMVTEEMIRMKL